MKFNSNWIKTAYWKTIDDEKIYFVGKDKIGTEYNLIRILVTSGMTSSSNARKIIAKIKEGEE